MSDKTKSAPETKPARRMFHIKYWDTRGIVEVPAIESGNYYTSPGGYTTDGSYFHVRASQIFEDLESAEAAVRVLAEKKVAKLEVKAVAIREKWGI